MDTSIKPGVRHLDREPFLGDVVLGRAAVVGAIGGALLGAVWLLPALSRYVNPYEWDVAAPTGLWLMVGGAFIGLLSALAAAAGWLSTADGPGPRPRASRAVAALAAAGTIMVPAVFLGIADDIVTAVSALVAGVLAAALAPAVGYRPEVEWAIRKSSM